MTPLSSDADVSAASDEDDEAELGAAERTKVTLCVSTQFGCAMGCVFCASGRAGLGRGLGADEIVSQVILARRFLDPNEDLTNLVFMGMGEPLHHYDETARALRLLTHPEGTGMSPRRITVSTVGLVPGLKKLGADFGGKVGLAVSLHAPDDATRERIVPMNKRYPLAELMQALRAYPLPKRRRITIEYTLIDGVNDSDAHADRLVRLLSGLPVKVNLIPMNPVAGSELRASPPERVDAFQARVAGFGYSCFVRARRGDEVSAACGQLALEPGLIELGRSRAPA
jgi:23S rRNA (adenine2503-C2)-methyltransferase